MLLQKGEDEAGEREDENILKHIFLIQNNVDSLSGPTTNKILLFSPRRQCQMVVLPRTSVKITFLS